MPEGSKQADEFQREGESGRTGLVTEFWDFLKHNKKWWLLPILVTMLLVGALAVLSSTAAAPFIYTLF